MFLPKRHQGFDFVQLLQSTRFLEGPKDLRLGGVFLGIVARSSPVTFHFSPAMVEFRNLKGMLQLNSCRGRRLEGHTLAYHRCFKTIIFQAAYVLKPSSFPGWRSGGERNDGVITHDPPGHEFFFNTLGMPRWSKANPCYQCNCHKEMYQLQMRHKNVIKQNAGLRNKIKIWRTLETLTSVAIPFVDATFARKEPLSSHPLFNVEGDHFKKREWRPGAHSLCQWNLLAFIGELVPVYLLVHSGGKRKSQREKPWKGPLSGY